jgi:aryl-alcohol dehydrogenase-like predicted oxidoreductase
MDRVTLGRTGLQVSVMGLGAGGDSRLGLHNHEERESTKLVHEALAHGVNFIDTAEAYGTEARLGKALRGRTRGEVVLSTKKTTNPAAGRLEPADVIASLEASLKRLETDYVDIYHLHGVAPEHYSDLRERIVPVLQKLREQGKLRYLGITEKFIDDPDHRMLQRALQDNVWDVVMVGFNILNQSARQRVFPRTLAQGVGTLIMFAVRRAFSRPERLRELLVQLAEQNRIAPALAETGLDFLVHADGAHSLPDAAYRFCRYEPGTHVVLSGTSEIAHLLENLQSLERGPLSAADHARLVELFGQIDSVSGH